MIRKEAHSSYFRLLLIAEAARPPPAQVAKGYQVNSAAVCTVKLCDCFGRNFVKSFVILKNIKSITAVRTLRHLLAAA
jgi:hypothetical protein